MHIDFYRHFQCLAHFYGTFLYPGSHSCHIQPAIQVNSWMQSCSCKLLYVCPEYFLNTNLSHSEDTLDMHLWVNPNAKKHWPLQEHGHCNSVKPCHWENGQKKDTGFTRVQSVLVWSMHDEHRKLLLPLSLGFGIPRLDSIVWRFQSALGGKISPGDRSGAVLLGA